MVDPKDSLELAGQRLRAIRIEKNLSLAEVSEDLDVGLCTIAQYETAKREPKFNILFKLAQYYDVNINYLFGYTENRTHFVE